MRFTVLYTVVSAALLLRPIIAGVMPRDLVERQCPNQEYDPNGILCSGDSGSYNRTSLHLLSPALFLTSMRAFGFAPKLPLQNF
jgi:hypothetical protein